jgi:hypothetical protein
VDLESLSREELIRQIREINDYMENVIVFWGGRKELRETLELVARNEDQEYTAEEAGHAGAIVGSDEAFDEFIEMIRDSFDRGGINFAISEKMSAIMQEVADRRGGR